MYGGDPNGPMEDKKVKCKSHWKERLHKHSKKHTLLQFKSTSLSDVSRLEEDKIFGRCWNTFSSYSRLVVYYWCYNWSFIICSSIMVGLVAISFSTMNLRRDDSCWRCYHIYHQSQHSHPSSWWISAWYVKKIIIDLFATTNHDIVCTIIQ